MTGLVCACAAYTTYKPLSLKKLAAAQAAMLQQHQGQAGLPKLSSPVVIKRPVLLITGRVSADWTTIS